MSERVNRVDPCQILVLLQVPTQEKEIDMTLTNKCLSQHIRYQNKTKYSDDNKIGLKYLDEIPGSSSREEMNIYDFKKLSFYPKMIYQRNTFLTGERTHTPPYLFSINSSFFIIILIKRPNV